MNERPVLVLPASHSYKDDVAVAMDETLPNILKSLELISTQNH
jgi:hypothetical protein